MRTVQDNMSINQLQIPLSYSPAIRKMSLNSLVFDHTPHYETTPPQLWPMRTQEEWPRVGMSSTISAESILRTPLAGPDPGASTISLLYVYGIHRIGCGEWGVLIKHASSWQRWSSCLSDGLSSRAITTLRTRVAAAMINTAPTTPPMVAPLSDSLDELLAWISLQAEN